MLLKVFDIVLRIFSAFHHFWHMHFYVGDINAFIAYTLLSHSIRVNLITTHRSGFKALCLRDTCPTVHLIGLLADSSLLSFYFITFPLFIFSSFFLFPYFSLKLHDWIIFSLSQKLNSVFYLFRNKILLWRWN